VSNFTNLITAASSVENNEGSTNFTVKNLAPGITNVVVGSFPDTNAQSFHANIHDTTVHVGGSVNTTMSSYLSDGGVTIVSMNLEKVNSDIANGLNETFSVLSYPTKANRTNTSSETAIVDFNSQQEAKVVNK